MTASRVSTPAPHQASGSPMNRVQARQAALPTSRFHWRLLQGLLKRPQPSPGQLRAVEYLVMQVLTRVNEETGQHWLLPESEWHELMDRLKVPRGGPSSAAIENRYATLLDAALGCDSLEALVQEKLLEKVRGLKYELGPRYLERESLRAATQCLVSLGLLAREPGFVSQQAGLPPAWEGGRLPVEPPYTPPVDPKLAAKAAAQARTTAEAATATPAPAPPAGVPGPSGQPRGEAPRPPARSAPPGPPASPKALPATPASHTRSRRDEARERGSRQRPEVRAAGQTEAPPAHEAQARAVQPLAPPSPYAQPPHAASAPVPQPPPGAPPSGWPVASMVELPSGGMGPHPSGPQVPPGTVPPWLAQAWQPPPWIGQTFPPPWQAAPPPWQAPSYPPGQWGGHTSPPPWQASQPPWPGQPYPPNPWAAQAPPWQAPPPPWQQPPPAPTAWQQPPWQASAPARPTELAQETPSTLPLEPPLETPWPGDQQLMEAPPAERPGSFAAQAPGEPPLEEASREDEASVEPPFSCGLELRAPDRPLEPFDGLVSNGLTQPPALPDAESLEPGEASSLAYLHSLDAGETAEFFDIPEGYDPSDFTVDDDVPVAPSGQAEVLGLEAPQSVSSATLPLEKTSSGLEALTEALVTALNDAAAPGCPASPPPPTAPQVTPEPGPFQLDLEPACLADEQPVAALEAPEEETSTASSPHLLPPFGPAEEVECLGHDDLEAGLASGSLAELPEAEGLDPLVRAVEYCDSWEVFAGERTAPSLEAPFPALAKSAPRPSSPAALPTPPAAAGASPGLPQKPTEASPSRALSPAVHGESTPDPARAAGVSSLKLALHTVCRVNDPTFHLASPASAPGKTAERRAAGSSAPGSLHEVPKATVARPDRTLAEPAKTDPTKPEGAKTDPTKGEAPSQESLKPAAWKPRTASAIRGGVIGAAAVQDDLETRPSPPGSKATDEAKPVETKAETTTRELTGPQTSTSASPVRSPKVEAPTASPELSLEAMLDLAELEAWSEQALGSSTEGTWEVELSEPTGPQATLSLEAKEAPRPSSPQEGEDRQETALASPGKRTGQPVAARGVQAGKALSRGATAGEPTTSFAARPAPDPGPRRGRADGELSQGSTRLELAKPGEGGTTTEREVGEASTSAGQKRGAGAGRAEIPLEPLALQKAGAAKAGGQESARALTSGKEVSSPDRPRRERPARGMVRESKPHPLRPLVLLYSGACLLLAVTLFLRMRLEHLPEIVPADAAHQAYALTGTARALPFSTLQRVDGTLLAVADPFWSRLSEDARKDLSRHLGRQLLRPDGKPSQLLVTAPNGQTLAQVTRKGVKLNRTMRSQPPVAEAPKRVARGGNGPLEPAEARPDLDQPAASGSLEEKGTSAQVQDLEPRQPRGVEGPETPEGQVRRAARLEAGRKLRPAGRRQDAGDQAPGEARTPQAVAGMGSDALER